MGRIWLVVATVVGDTLISVLPILYTAYSFEEK